ncbi:HPF/RaiA family ribosome-associated protein [Noviherbaspirillum saxi]|nr:HPF/RaiA family ribosome-associated protein [Noviherbaspirillum saxi]
MKPTIVAKGVKLPQVLRDYVVRRLQFALSHAREAIGAVVVRISDQNGPKGGVDKQCRIQITVPGMPSIIVSSKAGRIAEAIDLCAHRAALAIDRLRSRTRSIEHARFPALDS